MCGTTGNIDFESQSIEQVYVQGVGIQNEDAIVCRPEIGLFAVIDGATALYADLALSGAVAAQAVKTALDGWDGNGGLIDAVMAANRYLGQVTGGDALDKTARPTCCIAAVRVRNDRLEFAQVGDCMAFVEYKHWGTPGQSDSHGKDSPSPRDGTGTRTDFIRQLTHDSVAAFDTHSVQMLVQAWNCRLAADVEQSPDASTPPPRAKDLSSWSVDKQLDVLKEIRSELRPVLARHREMMNVSGGYSVMDGSAEVERFIEHGAINASLISRVLLMSDGLQLPTSKLHTKNGWLGTAMYGFYHGVRSLCSHVLELENQDPGCYVYPRLKPHDDKSGLLVTITDLK
ncbi:PP2C family serine/threonine-protein phosphatase [Alicyclobacillus mengziensis]|uniref:Protein phosphatase 2C family protein n=1 Tax=Alicyclobacillus mengziensis TaxID=2931921 RepID=A0A9X7VXW9_9BACL|nr:PP2C family serine/threonine-protein phosphatase [Alicyclobacillus mengziensis]QSO47061.1 protein phosphatase 2C family protein [Alicyclobacillus mengziensis]